MSHLDDLPTYSPARLVVRRSSLKFEPKRSWKGKPGIPTARGPDLTHVIPQRRVVRETALVPPDDALSRSDEESLEGGARLLGRFLGEEVAAG